jgi:hypothetical protein
MIKLVNHLQTDIKNTCKLKIIANAKYSIIFRNRKHNFQKSLPLLIILLIRRSNSKISSVEEICSLILKWDQLCVYILDYRLFARISVQLRIYFMIISRRIMTFCQTHLKYKGFKNYKTLVVQSNKKRCD